MIVLDSVTKSYPTPQGVKTVLDDVSITLPARCKLGILGLNGAGKSTLLDLISGAQLPTRGTVRRQGRISWPLGFAGGFNGRLSGLENCLFVSRIYGRNEKEIAAYVADFAELGRDFYLPVRSYSSGMRARLSFGLSLAFDFDYYLIDEVIAVGDARFQEKCRAALQNIHSRAGILMVSHARSLLRAYCENILVVHDKKLHFYESRREGYRFYKSLVRQSRGMPDGEEMIEGSIGTGGEGDAAAVA